jgi:hypothetical protein
MHRLSFTSVIHNSQNSFIIRGRNSVYIICINTKVAGLFTALKYHNIKLGSRPYIINNPLTRLDFDRADLIRCIVRGCFVFWRITAFWLPFRGKQPHNSFFHCVPNKFGTYFIKKFNFSLLSKLKISAPSHAREEATTSDVLWYLQSWSPDTSQYVCYRGAIGQIETAYLSVFSRSAENCVLAMLQ